MADVLKRLAGPTQLASSSASIYTVPALTTTVIRNIHVVNTTSGGVTFNLLVNAAASSTATALFYSYNVAPYGVVDWSGMIVLNAADYLTSLAGVATSLVLTISGVEVS